MTMGMTMKMKKRCAEEEEGREVLKEREEGIMREMGEEMEEMWENEEGKEGVDGCEEGR